MNTNLPILYRNVVDHLPNEFAVRQFLWACDLNGNDRMCYRAEEYALEAAELVENLKGLITIGAKVHRLSSGQHYDLLNFIMKRHANYFWGGNVSPPRVEFCE